MKFFAVLLLAVLCLQSTSADSICNCRMGALSKIKNGNATKGHIPWLVQIKHNLSPIGTGFLLTKNKVLTAASIVHDKKSADLSVIAGDLSKNLSVDQRWVRFNDIHPDFSAYRVDNGSDVAILTLAQPLELQRGKFELACLDLDFKSAPKSQLLSCIGYGVTKENGERRPSNVPRYALFEQVQGSPLKRVIACKPAVENTTVCDLDYGAPLHQTVAGRTRVVGIASYSEGGIDDDGNVAFCSGETYFTHLPSVKEFIELNVGKNHC